MHVVVVVGGVALGGSSNVDVLSPLGGVPIVVRSVRAMSGVGLDVCVLAPVDPARVRVACAEFGVPVHGSVADAVDTIAQRSMSTGSDGSVTRHVLVHDAARPLVPSALVGAVLDAARLGHAVVVPVLPLADTVKVVDVDGLVRSTPDRAGLRVVQTPQAYALDLLPLVLPAAVADPMHGWAAAGVPVHTVTGDPLAFAVHTAWDLELAESTIGADT